MRARTAKRARIGLRATAALEGMHGPGACMRVPLIMGYGHMPRGWRGAHTYVPIIRGANRGAHSSKEEGICGLPSSFEDAKPCPPGTLPSNCKVLCLGLWRQGDLALHT
jgi:hypothetical protein